MHQHELAEDIFDIIGPAENIKKAYNCMTRLRVCLHSQDNELIAKLKKIEGVLGVQENGEELQIILGPGRAAAITAIIQDLCQAIPPTDESPINDSLHTPQIGDGQELHAAIRKKNATPMKLLFKRIASIFLPLIPAFIACGLITGGLMILL